MILFIIMLITFSVTSIGIESIKEYKRRARLFKVVGASKLKYNQNSFNNLLK